VGDVINNNIGNVKGFIFLNACHGVMVTFPVFGNMYGAVIGIVIFPKHPPLCKEEAITTSL
jgi:hypothetical protein